MLPYVGFINLKPDASGVFVLKKRNLSSIRHYSVLFNPHIRFVIGSQTLYGKYISIYNIPNKYKIKIYFMLDLMILILF